MNDETLKIGVIGLDTSHAIEYADLLQHGESIDGMAATIIIACPIASEDFPLSASRVEGYTTEYRNRFGIPITSSPEEVVRLSDAILLLSADGRAHRKLLTSIVRYGKPVFIDKPFAVNSEDAMSMILQAKQHGCPIMSCSPRRYASSLTSALRDGAYGRIQSVDIYGPMIVQPTQPGLFWYGIHQAEALFTIMGRGCRSVVASAGSFENQACFIATWEDGRFAQLCFNQSNNKHSGALIHRETGTQAVDFFSGDEPRHKPTLEQVLTFFHSRRPTISVDETVEIIRFIEAANESMMQGKAVRL